MTRRDKTMRVREVADFFDVQPITVRDWLRKGILEGFKINNGPWRIKREAVDQLAQKMYGEETS